MSCRLQLPLNGPPSFITRCKSGFPFCLGIFTTLERYTSWSEAGEVDVVIASWVSNTGIPVEVSTDIVWWHTFPFDRKANGCSLVFFCTGIFPRATEGTLSSVVIIALALWTDGVPHTCLVNLWCKHCGGQEQTRSSSTCCLICWS